MTKHDWKERTEDGVRTWRATFHGGNWSMRSKLKSDEFWTIHDPMQRPELEALRDLLWRKYQRGRLPHKLVEQIDKMIEDLDDRST